MSIQKKLLELKDQKSYSSPAKRVMEHLKPILSKSNDLKQRWMWELLQNASDLGDNIKAGFEISNDSLVFTHNGQNFSLDEAFNLIMPDSSKDSDSGNQKSVIGQFGTGFISTHILSKMIAVAGVVEDGDNLYDFNFLLDRSERQDKEFLIQSIKESEKEYKQSLKKITSLRKEKYQTSFTYFIDDTYASLDGPEIVDTGLKKLFELIPYVFAFRPQLEEVCVSDKRSKLIKWVFKKDEVSSEINDLSITKTTFLKNGKFYGDTLIGTVSEHFTTIAFPIESLSDDRFRLLPFPDDCPKLFCAFPMIGTSGFNFPVIIHSNDFAPNRERDGIEITEYDSENLGILDEAKDCYIKLLHMIEEYQWTDAFNVCRLSSPDFGDKDVNDWFTRSIFNPIKEAVRKAKLVELDESLDLEEHRAALDSIYIPYADKRLADRDEVVMQVYDFAYRILPTILPKKEHCLAWYEILDFEIFKYEKFGIEEICNKVTEDMPMLDKFAEEFEIEKDEAVNFLVNLVDYILEQEHDELLNKYPLVLNQNDEFAKAKNLSLDSIEHKGLADGYAEKLKDIFKYLNEDDDYRNSLLHKSFEHIDNLIALEDKLDFKDLAKDTDEALRNYDGNFQDEGFLKILKELFNWYTSCGVTEDTLSKLFPYFSANKSQIYLNTKTPEELDFAFDIEISGKSEVLAKIAKSSLTESELDLLACNPELISSFIKWVNSKQEDNPNEELGDIGEEFLYHQLCQIFGEDRVLWEDKSEYDFRILEGDRKQTMYFIDVKTTGRGIANSDNVPFFMRKAQWNFLSKKQALDKYVIARIFKSNEKLDVRYLKLNVQSLN